MSYLKRAEKRGPKFQNPVPTSIGGLSTMSKVLPRLLLGKEERIPTVPPGPFRTDASNYESASPTGLRVTWFGHSSTLLEIDGFRILIDPIWEQRASPSQWFGPKRFWAPTLELANMPRLDVVLLSHDHYDHLGADTVRSLLGLPCTAEARWVTSLGVGRRLRAMGVPEHRITELDWTETTAVEADGRQLRVTAWPTRHFSGRGLRDRFTTLWSSFVIEGPDHRVYFGADSGWWDGFAEIGARYDGFDLAMLEIGAFDPLWEQIHLGPDNALRAYQALGGAGKAGLLMPIHWGLFSLGLHGWRQPMERLELIGEGVPLWSPEPGLPTEVEGPAVAGWWRSLRR